MYVEAYLPFRGEISSYVKAYLLSKGEIIIIEMIIEGKRERQYCTEGLLQKNVNDGKLCDAGTIKSCDNLLTHTMITKSGN